MEDLSPLVLSKINSLDDSKKQLFWAQYGAQAKSTGTAYICWFFGGVHYFYLGKAGKNLGYWFTGGGLLVWVIMDAFRMKNLVTQVNDDKALKILTLM